MTENTAPQNAGRSRRRVYGALLVAVLAAAGGGWLVGRRPAVPSPPGIDPAAADPAAVAAIEQARRAVARAPHAGAPWGRLGMLLIAHGYYAEALPCLTRAAELDPFEPRWPYYHGLTVLLTDPEAALPWLQRAADLDEGAEAARLKLAEVQLAQGRIDEAEALFRWVLRRRPNQPRAQLGAARVAHARGRWEDTDSLLSQASVHPLTQKAAATLRAEARQRRGDRDGALRAAGQAAELPEDPPPPDPWVEEVEQLKEGQQARRERADVLLRQGRGAEAVALLRKAVEDYPEAEAVWLQYGRALTQLRDYPGAEQALRRAADLAPRAAEAQFHLGVALFFQKKPEAEACFRRATELKKDYALAHFNLGHCLAARGDADGAIRAHQEAVRCRPYFAAAHAALAELLTQRGRTDEARTHRHHAAAAGP